MTLPFVSLRFGGPAYGQGAAAGLNWMYPSYDSGHTGFNPQTIITKDNVNDLQLQWISRMPLNPYFGKTIPDYFNASERIPMLEKAEGVETNPLVINGIVYVTTPFGVLEARSSITGNVIWKFETNVNGASEKPWIENRGIQRSITYHDGNIFILSQDCTIYGLDARTGQEKVKIPDTCKDVPGNIGRYYGEEAPVFYKDIAIVSASSGFGQARGVVRAYDLNTGKMLWQWFSIPPQEYGATLEVDWAKGNIDPYPNDWVGSSDVTGPSGAAVRTIGAVDEEKGVVYFGTGPPIAIILGAHTHPPLADTPGPNLYSNTIVALNATSGELIWYYQVDPHDVHRQGIYGGIILTDINVGGSTRRVVMAHSFQGFVYVLDAATGKPLYDPVAVGAHLNDMNANKGNNANLTQSQGDIPKDSKGQYAFCPGAEGGVSAPMAYAYGKIYAAAQNDCFQAYMATIEALGRPVNQWEYATAGYKQNSTIYAIDASNGKIAWQYNIPNLYWFAGITVSGGVVYALDQPGYLWMLDADTGQLLRSIKLDFSGSAGVSIASDARGRMMLFIVVGASELVVPTEGLVLAYALPEQEDSSGGGGGELMVPVTYAVAAAAAVAVVYTVALVVLLKRRSPTSINVEADQKPKQD
ncbi:MAG: PQQ-binding-like beta-propeller repeat protein [Thaumarchaeota archaeon]|nr:PQQ-binding-like beta-propeller repeat protein [Nitrososphaerota archaeon]